MQVPQKLESFFKGAWNGFVSLATNKFFSLGLVVLIALVGVGYLAIDRLVMPSYVRYDTTITVPDVKEMQVDEATILIQSIGLQVEVESSRYNPQLERNVVVDQNPPAEMYVKPGRRIYLTINTGATPEVTVPSLEGISLNDARYRLNAAGLIATNNDIRPDSIPSPHKNTVTRQFPAAGKVVEEGSRVRLWYSTGLGRNYVSVPNVIGLTAEEAEQRLLSMRLRSVIIHGAGPGTPSTADLIVKDQSNPEGTRIREGSEIRLFVEPPAEEEQ